MNAPHGALDFGELRELGLRPDQVLDFSANVNPSGPSPAVLDAVRVVPVGRYPDRDCLDLRAALVQALQSPERERRGEIAPSLTLRALTTETLLPGNGASELIWLAALAFIRPASRVVVIGPTFSEYARAAAIMGAAVSILQAPEATAFAFDLAAIATHLDASRPDVVFLCNPNNPTGAVVPPDEIAGWAQRHPETLFVVDEAYLPFAAGLRSVLAFHQPNVLVLRSMTKDHGLAGLRLGYAVGEETRVAALRQVQPPWSVNALAQAAGVAALRDPGHYRRSLERLRRGTAQLIDGLSRLGLTPLPSTTHFFLLRVGDAAAFRARLLRRRILVRDCASFGLPAYVRIAARTAEENERLLAAVREEGHAG
jgi:histidinol-phosphate aminotransferase